MDKEKYNQEINKATIICWTIISLVLIVSYIIEIFKGLRSPQYVITFSIFTILPLIITIIFNIKWKGENENIKYFATIGYIIFYTFSLLTTQSRVSFVYIIPMISILIAYCDTKIISILYIYSILLNVVVILNSIISGKNTKEDLTFYEIQMACLILSYIFLAYTMTLIKKNKDTISKLSSSLVTDELTSAYNRKFISQNIIPNFDKYIDNGISLAFLDIDHFGDFNNTYGHQFGDTVLKQLSDIVFKNISDYDNIYFIRNGGDEFLLVSFGAEYRAFTNLCEHIKKDVENHKLEINNKLVNITVSVGCANSKIENYDDFFDLKDKADERLYVSKDNGRNKITIDAN